MTMWQCHLRLTVTALALGLALSTLPWVGVTAPAKRSAPATPPAPAPTEAERALALFKDKAEQFRRFLAEERLILSKQDFSGSPTGVNYYHVRVKLLESGFDVQRSDSLVSPFMGYLNLTYKADSNEKCGDIMIDHGFGRRRVYGYTTYEKAMPYVHDCFQPTPSAVEDIRLTFAYQDGRWVFKDAIRIKYNNKDLALLAALGRPEPRHYRVADNQAWEALIK